MDLTLKTLDQKVVGTGLKTTIMGFIDLAFHGEHGEGQTNTLQLTLMPPAATEAVQEYEAYHDDQHNVEKDLVEMIRTIEAVKKGLDDARRTPPAFDLTGASVELNFLVCNDGSIDIVWEGEYHREQTNTLALTFGPTSTSTGG